MDVLKLHCRDVTEFRFSCRINTVGYVLIAQLTMETENSLLIPTYLLSSAFCLISAQTDNLWTKSFSILFVKV